MPRPNYSLNISAPWTIRRGNNQTFISSGISLSAEHSEEVSVGVARRKPTGWVAPTSYSLTHKSYRLAYGVTDSTNRSIVDTYSGVVGGSRFNSLDHFNELVQENQLDALMGDKSNRALIKARLKMKRSDVNLGVAFAERNATARMLGDTAIRLAKAFNNLKRGQVRSAMNVLGISSSKREPRGSNAPRKWLELQYGWKPLASDIFGACNALSKRDKSDWVVTAKAQVREEYRYMKTWTSLDYGNGIADAEVGAFVRIDALPQNDLVMSLASLGITNPLLIAWELVPFSFVVDWALPIGTWLDSIDAMLGYGTSYTSTTTLIRCRWSGSGAYGKWANNPSVTIRNNYKEWKRYVKLVRTAQAGVPLPTFPGLKDPASLSHMANGLSLLASAFGKR